MPKRYKVKSPYSRRRSVKKYGSKLTAPAGALVAKLYTSHPFSTRVGFAPRAIQNFESTISGFNNPGTAGGYFFFGPQQISAPWNVQFPFTGTNNSSAGLTQGSIAQPYSTFAAAGNIYGSFRCLWYTVEIMATPALAGDSIQVVTIPSNETNLTTIGLLTIQQIMGNNGSQTGVAMFGSPVLRLKSYVNCATVAGMTKAQFDAQAPTPVGNPISGAAGLPYAVQQLCRWGTQDGAVTAGQILWTIKIVARIELSNPNVVGN
jgi:hypothetical protein